VKCPACTTRFLVEAVGDESATIPPHPESDQRRIETSESTRSTEDSTRELTGESTDESTGGQRQDSADSGHQVALSLDDQLSCPNCEQRLRVPIERRPVKARCPACRSEFMAEVGEE
jgi:DNA-directed RNA polymerase subunit RPC12/RpoP